MLHSVWLLGTFATRSASRVFGRNSMTNASFSMGNVCVKQGAIVEPSSRFDAIVGKADDLADGMMKEVQVQTEPALSVILVKNKGNITAVGNKCTHYGAPLIKGSFSADTGVIRCPWHGACFNAQTGDIEDFPGLDSLPRYDVSVEDDGSVRVRGTFVKGQHKRAKTCARVDEEGQTVVIIGGGGAAQTCAETLRTRTRSPWTGKIIMLSKEISAPYDRPKLSKAMTSSGKDLKLRPEYFHQGANIDLRTGVEAVGVDVSQKVVQIKADSLLSQLSYDYLVLATGGQPRKLKIAGSQLNNILELRTPEDANRIAANAQGKTVVIVGSSFIGTEVAAFMAGKAASVTVICRTDYPLERSLGKEVGKYVQSLHEAKGVKFMPRADVEAFSATEENSSAVAFVHLVGKEETLKADLVVLGVGVVPATTFLKGSGVELNSSGNVEVNENLETSCPGVFAAGDIANFPLQLPTVGGDQRVAIGHWQIAQTHGRTVGLNLGLPDSEKSALKTVPFFWTVQYGKSLRYAGYAPNYDDIIYDGSVAEGSFVAYYCHEDSVLAVATLGRDPVAAHFANYLLTGKLLSKGEAVQGDWQSKF